MTFWRVFAWTVLTASIVASAPQSSIPTPTSDCPAPWYPASLRNVDGKIDARISVRADGSVSDVAMVTSNSDSAFAKAAIDALRQWHFKPSARPEDATSRVYVTTVFLTPPQGMPLQFAVDSAIRRRLTEHDGVVTIHEGKDWIYSALLFGDFDFTADVRSAQSMSALRVRAWPGFKSPATGYEIALGVQDDRRTLTGAVTGQHRRPVTTTYDAAAAEAFGTSTDWEPIEVECIDKRLRVSLGGHLVTEVEVPDESGGRIALGVSKGVLEVRNLRVRRLDRVLHHSTVEGPVSRCCGPRHSGSDLSGPEVLAAAQLYGRRDGPEGPGRRLVGGDCGGRRVTAASSRGPEPR